MILNCAKLLPGTYSNDSEETLAKEQHGCHCTMLHHINYIHSCFSAIE